MFCCPHRRKLTTVRSKAENGWCVVKGFHVVQRGVVRGTEDGMKK